VENIHNINTTTPHIETPNATTVTIYYTTQSIWCLTWAGDTPIIPKKVWQTIPPKLCEQQGEFVRTGNLTVSGPYLIDSYKKGEWWLLRANPYFFRYSPPHDLSLTEIQSEKTIVGEGYGMDITVNVENIGYFNETATITLYANSTIIGSQSIYIETGKSSSITLTWDTTGFTKGNYTLWAYAEPVPGEIDTENNIVWNSIVLVSCIGDVNGDRKTDIKDYQLVKSAIPSVPGGPKWNPNLDINNDGKIDVKDYQIVKSHIPSAW
jgi:hypothetical protein